MSYALVDKVCDLNLPPQEKLTLISLARHAHNDGTEARPSVETMTRETNLGRRTIQRKLRTLEEKHLIGSREEKLGGRHYTVWYDLLLDNWGSFEHEKNATQRPVNRRQRDALCAETASQRPVKGVSESKTASASTLNSVTVTPESVLNLSKNLSSNPSTGEPHPNPCHESKAEVDALQDLVGWMGHSFLKASGRVMSLKPSDVRELVKAHGNAVVREGWKIWLTREKGFEKLNQLWLVFTRELPAILHTAKERARENMWSAEAEKQNALIDKILAEADCAQTVAEFDAVLADYTVPGGYTNVFAHKRALVQEREEQAARESTPGDFFGLSGQEDSGNTEIHAILP